MMKIPVIALLFPLLFQGNVASAMCDVGDIPVSTVVTPANMTAYDQARKQFATQMGTKDYSDLMLSPLAIVYCQNDDDVLATIDFASECGYKLSVRSGGHQYSGFSSCEVGTKCLQVDVSLIKTFKANGTEVTLGVGLSLEEAIGSMGLAGVVLPTGVCKQVHVGGHFQTSGLGFTGRSFGLGMDHMKSIRLAVANGTIVEVTPSNDPDLFKAILGGGPGSWGITLDYTFDAIAQEDYPHAAVVVFEWNYRHDLVVKIGKVYADILAIEAGARDFSPIMTVEQNRVRVGNFKIHIAITWVGVDSGDLYSNTTANYATYIQPFRDVEEPNVTFVDMPMPLTYAVAFSTYDMEFAPHRYDIGSWTTEKFNLDDDFWELTAIEFDARVALAAIKPVSFTSQFVGMGGAGEGSQINRNKGLNSYGWRDAKVHVDDWFFYLNDEDRSYSHDHITGYKAATKKYWKYNGKEDAEYTFMTTETLEATTDELAESWKLFYPNRKMFEHLMLVKSRVDPHDIFSTDHTVPLPKKRSSKSMKSSGKTMMSKLSKRRSGSRK